MKREKLEQVIVDQREELANVQKIGFCRRKEESFIDLESHLAQVVIGVRRSGKSTLCVNALEHAKVKYAYINFDDDRLAKADIDDMDTVLELLYKVYGQFTHLLLDEIQNIDGWHLFVNRLLRQGLHIVVTGSNSKLLSGELASHLTGRHHQIELLPFSFEDFCAYKKIPTSPLTTKNRGLLAGAFDDYLKQGGFPELMFEKDAKNYIDRLLDNIIRQDLQKRFNIRYIETLMQLTNHLLNETPAELVKDKLQKMFSFKSMHTLENYISYLEQTYVISILKKYSTKSRQRLRAPKYYPIDVAFMDKRSDAFSGENLGMRMEVIVYLELRRRTRYALQDIYYFSNQRSECDFIVCDRDVVSEAYQVSYDITNPKTLQREINGCVAAAKETKCKNLFLIVYNGEKQVVEKDGYKINILPVWEWLVNEKEE